MKGWCERNQSCDKHLTCKIRSSSLGHRSFSGDKPASELCGETASTATSCSVQKTGNVYSCLTSTNTRPFQIYSTILTEMRSFHHFLLLGGSREKSFRKLNHVLKDCPSNNEPVAVSMAGERACKQGWARVGEHVGGSMAERERQARVQKEKGALCSLGPEHCPQHLKLLLLE